jgi:hypothetical protein
MDKETASGLLKMKLTDFFKSYPQGVSLYRKHNMGCIGCTGVLSETVETSCLMHGVSPLELLRDLPEIRGSGA